jgi:CubicO group peptidase (beta-lactamase class C family)
MKIFALPFLLCFTSSFSFCQTTLSNAQKAYLTAICTRDVPAGAPGVACGIVQHGEILYTHFTGFADLDDSVKISAESRFNIASNAKQFTALAVLRLIEKEKLSINDELGQFFPELQYTSAITIQQLLTHTSGIRDVYDLWGLQGITWWKETFSNQDAINLLCKQADLNFSPGAQYLYSNSNYLLLAEIVSKVSGQSFQDYTNQMFRELGLADTAFESDHQKVKGPIARPYFNFNTWTTYDWIWDIVGDGNLFSTLSDQLRWEQIIQDKRRSPDWRMIIEQSQQKIPGSEGLDYAYGLEFGQFKGESILFHHGSTGAWKATFMRFPERQLTIMTLSNSGKTDVVSQNEAIAAYLLDKTNTTDFLTAPEQAGSDLSLPAVSGTYEHSGGSIFKFAEKEDGLYLVREGRSDVLLERTGPNLWQQVYDPAFKQEFTKDRQGNTLVTVYHSSHAPYSLRKIETDWTNFNGNTLNGEYFNPETGVKVLIEHQGDQTFSIKIGERNRNGELLTPQRMVVGGYRLQFFKEEDQTGFYLSGDRIQKIIFQKK